MNDLTLITTKCTAPEIKPSTRSQVLDEILTAMDGSSDNWDRYLPAIDGEDWRTAGILKDFQDEWTDRCLNENKIALSVFEANCEWLPNESEVNSALNRKQRRAGFGRVLAWSCGVAFVQEDGTIWQGRTNVFEVSKDGKPIKYLSPTGVGAQVYRPNIPTDIRVLMSKRWEVEIPLDGSFWDWFSTSKEARKIPLLITEGGTKALSLISLGIPCVSLYGCSSAWEKDQLGYRKGLLPPLREVVSNHPVHFAFDSDGDSKPKAQANVRRALIAIGKKVSLLAFSVNVMTWKPEQGKGIDDFIAANGGEAVDGLMNISEDFKRWKSKELSRWAWNVLDLYGGKAKADITANANRISGCGFPLPELGTALFVSGYMGAGKTFWFGEVGRALRAENPDMLWDSIGHRINLLKQTAQRLEQMHIQDAGCGNLTSSLIENTAEMAYCLDSLWRRFDTLIRAMDRGVKVLLTLDEIDALMKHVLLSTIISSIRRIQMLAKFSILLKKIAAGNGWIIGGEANLSALSVQSLKEFSGGTLKIVVAENEAKPKPWDIHIVGYEKKSQCAANQKKAALALITQLRSQGKRVLFLATSQGAAEEIEGIFNRKGDKTGRIDAKTSPEPWAQNCLRDAGEFFKTEKFDLFCGSPSIESGLSIDGEDLFDAVVLYASSLEPSVGYQMLGRLRDASVPRYVVAAEYSQQGTQHQFDPNEVCEKWEKSMKSAIKKHNLLGHIEVETIKIATELASKYIVRESAGAAVLGAALYKLLEHDGHKMISHEIDETLDGTEGETLKEAKKIAKEERKNDWKAANDRIYTAKQAREKMKSSDLLWLDKVACTKAIKREKYGDLVDSDEWIETYWADERDGRRMENAVLTAAEYNNEGIAEAFDRRELTRQVKTTGTIWGASFRGREVVIELLKKLDLRALNFAGTEIEFPANSDVVNSIFNSALRFADEVQEVLSLTITPQTNRMSFVSDLLHGRLGYSFEVSRRMMIEVPEEPEDKMDEELTGHQKYLYKSIGDFGDQLNQKAEVSLNKRGRPKGPKTKRVRFYKLLTCPHHGEMMELFVVAHQKYEKEFEAEIFPVQTGGEVSADVDPIEDVLSPINLGDLHDLDKPDDPKIYRLKVVCESDDFFRVKPVPILEEYEEWRRKWNLAA